MEAPYKLFSKGFWRAYFITMRPYLLFVSGVTSLAGLSTLHQIPPLKGILAFCVFFLSYGFGQALTDCFQIDTDTLSSPYRPLVQGIITKEQVLITSITGLLALCLILYILNPIILIPAFLSVAGLATYSFFKRLWWAGPFYNAWIVALIPVMSRMIVPDEPLLTLLIIPIVACVFFSYTSFVIVGYFKDISADREAGYQTFLVKFGWKPGCFVADTFVILSIISCVITLILISSTQPHFITFFMSIVCCITGAIFGINSLLQLHAIRSEKEAYRPIANVLRMYVLLLLSLSCYVNFMFLLFAFVLYTAFEVMLKRRPEKSQI